MKMQLDSLEVNLQKPIFALLQWYVIKEFQLSLLAFTLHNSVYLIFSKNR